jgi:hypothetical protein
MFICAVGESTDVTLGNALEAEQGSSKFSSSQFTPPQEGADFSLGWLGKEVLNTAFSPIVGLHCREKVTSVTMGG